MPPYLLAPPSTLGLPKKFATWREGQDKMTLDVLDKETRFICLAAPTGTGKSLTYIYIALLLGLRCLILTGSKALQDQIAADFGSVGLFDVRGRNNFRCEAANGTCEDGAFLRCQSCPYRVQVEQAKKARIVTSNYDFWLAIRESSTSIGEFDYLFLDEAHIADDKVCDSLAITLRTEAIYKELGLRFPVTKSLRIWRAWATEAALIAESKRKETEAEIENSPGKHNPAMSKRAAMFRRLHLDIARLADARGVWVLSQIPGGYLWSILWAAPYSEQVLFRGIPNVVLLSATLVRKSVTLLGIPEATRTFIEYPYTFPPQRSRILHIPTARISSRSTAEDWRIWAQTIDNILRGRRDRKGLIHTISYKNRDYLLQHSAFARGMTTHDRDNTSEVIGRFEFMLPPAVLVSPSIETGYDFLGRKAEFQIIGKLPFPDTRIPVLRARQESDPEYGPHLMIQRLVQACGRIRRSPNDQGETFITDDNFLWAWKRYRKLYPAWFLRLVLPMQRIPTPPPPLTEGEWL